MGRRRTGATCKFCGAQGLAWWHDPDKVELDGSKGGYRLTLPARDPVTGEPQYAEQTWTDKQTGQTRTVKRLVPDTNKVHKCREYRQEQERGSGQGTQAQSSGQAPEQHPGDDSDDEAPESEQGEQMGKGSGLEEMIESAKGELEQARIETQAEHDAYQGSWDGQGSDQGTQGNQGTQKGNQGKGSKGEQREGKQSEQMSEAAQKAQQLAELLKSMGAGQSELDEERVREIAREEDAKALQGRTQTLRLRVEREGKQTQEIEGAHPLLPLLVTILSSNMHAYLYGPRGSGKTTAAQMAAKALGREYGYISLNPQTADSRVNGFIDANGIFRDTVFVRLYQNGGVFCIDEMDHASGNILTALNGAIENGHASFPCGMVARHPDFVLVATGNTPGRGPTPDHPERRGFDGATGDRFAYIFWPYDTSVEERATLSEHPQGGAWLAWVRKVREYASANDPRLIVSPRASIMGAKIISSGALDTLSGEQERKAMLADAVLFKGWDKDTVKRILNAVPMPSYRELKGSQGSK